jgi:hypothetical protein
LGSLRQRKSRNRKNRDQEQRSHREPLKSISLL